jgi:hypothetical protein
MRLKVYEFVTFQQLTNFAMYGQSLGCPLAGCLFAKFGCEML